MSVVRQQSIVETTKLTSQYEKEKECFENLKFDMEGSNNENNKLQSEIDKLTDEKDAVGKELALKESEIVESNNKLAALTETIEEKTSKEIQLRRDIGMLLHCLFLHNVFFFY